MMHSSIAFIYPSTHTYIVTLTLSGLRLVMELENIKDADVKVLGLPIQKANKLQDMCIPVYLKKTKEKEHSEFIKLLREINFEIPDLYQSVKKNIHNLYHFFKFF